MNPDEIRQRREIALAHGEADADKDAPTLKCSAVYVGMLEQIVDLDIPALLDVLAVRDQRVSAADDLLMEAAALVQDVLGGAVDDAALAAYDERLAAYFGSEDVGTERHPLMLGAVFGSLESLGVAKPDEEAR